MLDIADKLMPPCGMVGTAYWVGGFSLIYFGKMNTAGGALMAAGAISWYRYLTERQLPTASYTGK